MELFTREMQNIVSLTLNICLKCLKMLITWSGENVSICEKLWKAKQDKCSVSLCAESFCHFCSQQQSSGAASGPGITVSSFLLRSTAFSPLSLCLGSMALTTSINRRWEQQRVWTLHQGQAALNTMLKEQTGIDPRGRCIVGWMLLGYEECCTQGL